MLTLRTNIIAFFGVIFLAAAAAFSQETEAQLTEKINALFKDEKFVEAKPLAERLITINPRSYDAQYKFGACLLYSGYKKQDAFKYLKYAVTDPTISPDAYFFLAKAYHLTYQFKDAITNYEVYKAKAGAKPNPNFQVDRQIEMCRNATKLLSTITEIAVVEKKEIEIANFFRLYNLKDIGGVILVAADFQSKVDKKKGYTPIIHFPAGAKVIYYASYGDSDKGQKDIYYRNKLPNGEWGMPQLVGGNVNTTYDEDFPYMHPDGKYLYFSSKGHNSMGGYDVYRAEYDPNSNSFGVPENIDFAISSPDDDMFYVVDSLDQNAYFASSRQSNNGKLFVYKVKVKRYPLQLAVIKGSFSSTIHPENKAIQITVSNAQTGEKIGTFNTNEKGDYLITLPKSGKYTYEMKVKGSTETHKSTITVPYSKEFRPLKQQLQEELVTNAEQVKILNLFDQTVENPEEILAELMLRKSELNVNADQFQNEESNESSGVLAALGITSDNPQTIVVGFENIQNIQKENKEGVERLINGANTTALNNAKEAEKLQNEAKALVARTNNVSSAQEKFNLLKQADEKLEKAAELKTESAELVRFSDSLQPTLHKETAIFNEVKGITDQVKSLVQEEKLKEVVALVEPKLSVLKEVQKDDKKDVLEAILAEKKAITDEGNKLEQQHAKALSAEAPLKKELETLKQELNEAKAKDKAGIESKIAFKEQEIADAQSYSKQLESKMEANAKQEEKVDRKLNELQRIASGGNGSEVVTSEQVKTAIATADTPNARSLKSYVDQQLASLEKDPTLQSNGTIELAEVKKDISVKSTEIEELITKHKNESLALETAEITATEKAQLKRTNDQLALTKIDDVLQLIDAAQEKEPTAFVSEEQALKADRKEILDHQNEQRLVLAQAPENKASIEPVKDIVSQIDPTYDAKKGAVKESDPAKQLTALNQVDKSLVEQIDREIEKVSAQPNSPQNEQRLLSLVNAKAKTQENILNREQSIAALSPQEAVTLTEEDVMAALVPNVKERQAQINQKDPKDQLAETVTLNNEIIAAAQKEKQLLESKLKADPDNQQIEQKLALVNQIIEAKTQEKITAEQQLAAANTVVKVPTKAELMAKIAPAYNEDINALANLPTPEKAEKRLALEEKTLTALLEERKEIEESGSPTTTQKLELIDELIAEKQTIISEQKKVLNIESPVVLNEQEVIADLIPNYATKQADISAKEVGVNQLIARNKLDEQLIEAATEERTQLKSLINPTAEQKEKTNVLDRLIAAKQQEVKERELEIDRLKQNTVALNNTENNANDVAALKTSLRPNYTENIQKIESNPQLSEKQKTAALVAEDQSLLEAINKELDKNTASLNKGSTDSTLIKKNEQLKELQAIQEAKLEEEKSNAIALAAVQPEEIIQTVLPTFVVPSDEELLNPSNKQRLVEQEKALQAALVKEQVANKKVLNKGFDAQIAAENNAIEEALMESDKRLEILKTVTDVPSNTTSDPAAVASRLNPDIQKIVAEQPSNVENATSAISALSELKTTLEKEKKALEKRNAPAAEVDQKTNEMAWVTAKQKELERFVQDQNQTVSTVVPENVLLRMTPEQQQSIASPTSIEQAKSDLIALTSLEKTLAAEQKTLQKEKATEQQLTNKQAELQVVADKKKELEVWVNKQSSEVKNPTTAEKTGLEALQAEEANLLKQIETGTPADQKKAEKALVKNQAEQQELIQQQEQKLIAAEKASVQNTLNTLPVSDAFKQNAENQLKQENVSVQQVQRTQNTVEAVVAIQSIEKIVQTSGVVPITLEEAVSLRKTITIEIGELEAERLLLKQQNKQPERQQELSAYITELQNQLKVIDQIEPQLKKDSPIKAFQTIASQQEVSAEQDQSIRSDKSYKGIYEEYQQVQQLQGEWNALSKKENELRKNNVNKDLSEAVIAQLKQLKIDKEAVESDMKRALESLNSTIQRSGMNSLEVQNVLWRDQMPIVVQPQIANTTIIAEGFQINANPNATTIKSARELPVGVKAPSGLVYRVQVGAFAKPVPEELFKEFTPVTGEKLQNGITRYMAGYFGNRGKVIQAQNQIRNLGYKDAFVVAYCDGVRISMAEAKRLEEQGLCVPKNQDSMVMEVVQNTLAQLPDSLKTTKIEAPSIDAYNKAPDAVPAEAVELRKGLFYTVQVGVYNRPATKDQLKNIQPLVTKRLPNGQLRYSSGIFLTIPDARPKKAEAIALGITDAFITAYYNGERISLEEAKRLLDENGPSILTVIEPTRVDTLQINEMVKNAISNEQQSSTKKGKQQLVSVQRYSVVPQAQLEQLSAKGQFYYDSETQQIKSQEVVLGSELPALGELMKMDTVVTGEIEEKIAQEQGGWIIQQTGEVQGEVANVLLQNNIPFTVLAGKDLHQIVVLRKNSRNFEPVLNQLSLIGVSVTTYNQFKDEK